jgi:SNF2 family DNA or RNA helicase
MSPDTLERPYQRVGIEWLKQANDRLLGDDAGLGKTYEAIKAADELLLANRLVICPAVARLVWPNEIRKWSLFDYDVIVLEPGAPLPKPSSHPRTVIVAFDTISSSRDHHVVEWLRAQSWDVVIIDEGHKLANPGSNRTKRIYGKRLDRVGGIIERAARVWVLSGTLTPNHSAELYTHAKTLFPTTMRLEYFEFVEKFCRFRDTQWGRVIIGSNRTRELRELMAPHVLRRRKQEVLPELPPLDFVAVPIALDPVKSPWDELLPLAGDGEELQALLDNPPPALTSFRRELGRLKVHACAEYIEDLLEAGVPKIVVFAHHTDVIRDLAGALGDHGPVTFMGATTERDRASAITKFQNEPDTRVFVGQLDACGTAITLTAAKDVVFVECSWVPGTNYQAASRCHRLGQRDGVLARMLYVPKSLDERIMRVFRRKAQDIAELWD